MTGLKESLYQLLLDLNIPEVVSNLIVIVIVVVLWILVGVLIHKSVRSILYKVLKIKQRGARAITLGKLISNVTKYFIWFVIGIVVLSEMNVDITPFIASAGVIGLAVGFGAQAIVKDFISGFFIIFEESFNAGDIIEVNGFKGTVLVLGLRTTRIQSWKGEINIINNGDIRSVINYSMSDSIAIVEFGVGYNTDLLKLQRLLDVFVVKTNELYEEIIEVPSYSGVIELAESSINLRITAKTKSQLHFKVERDIRRDLVILLNENGIEIPFPQLVIHHDKD